MTPYSIIDSAISFAGALPDIADRTPAYLLATAWYWLPTALIGTAAVVATRVFLVRRALRNRVAYDLIPTSEFDPKAEEILRFAQSMAHAQRSASRWKLTPRRGLAMRVRLTSNGGLTMRIEGPAASISVLSHQAYAGCEVRSADARPKGPGPAPARITFINTPLADPAA